MSRERFNKRNGDREERCRRREEQAAQRLARDLERLNDSLYRRSGETLSGINLNRGHFAISTPSRVSETDTFFYDRVVSSSDEQEQRNPFGISPIREGEENSATQSSSLELNSRKGNLNKAGSSRRISKLRPRMLNFWDDPNFEISQFFNMAVPAARATIRLADFAQFAGHWDEDPDAYLQKFEVTYVANEIVDDDQKLHILPATFKEEATSWYGNLDVGQRATYPLLRDAFLNKFRRQGFQDRLAQQLDYLLQGVNESIDNYIQRMETIVRKMGANAPNDDTQKRRLVDGLRDIEAQKYVGLRRPADLAAAKQEARNWEEVQISQQRRRELLHGPTGVPTSYNSLSTQGQTMNSGATQPQVVVNTNPTPYMPHNPYMTAPVYMLQTGTPPANRLNEKQSYGDSD